MNTTKRLVATALLVAAATPVATADAKPNPYERRAVTVIKTKQRREGMLKNLVVNLPKFDTRGKARVLHPYER